MIIMGIDPGLASTGYGVIKVVENQLSIIDYGVIQTRANLPFVERLNKIHKEQKKIIKKYRPDRIAVEEIYFAKNAKTALKVGQARGVALLTIIQAKISVDEFTPLQVKQAITGYGRASKSQMQKMVKVLLGLKEIPRPDDAADALATAICCTHSNRSF